MHYLEIFIQNASCTIVIDRALGQQYLNIYNMRVQYVTEGWVREMLHYSSKTSGERRVHMMPL